MGHGVAAHRSLSSTGVGSLEGQDQKMSPRSSAEAVPASGLGFELWRESGKGNMELEVCGVGAEEYGWATRMWESGVVLG